jgi:hypothetical protein
MEIKTGHFDINNSKHFKTNLSRSVVVEKILFVMKSKSSVVLEQVDESTIYFENFAGNIGNRWDPLYGASFGKLIVLPSDGGVQIHYQISILTYRILALAFLLFGFVVPIYLFFSGFGIHFFICLQIPIVGFGMAAFSYLFMISLLMTRLDNIISQALNIKNAFGL